MEENLLQKLLAAVNLGGQSPTIPITQSYDSGTIIEPVGRTNRSQPFNVNRNRNVTVTSSGLDDAANKAVNKAIQANQPYASKGVFGMKGGQAGPMNRLAFSNQFQNALKGNSLILGNVDVAAAQKAGMGFNPATGKLIMPKGMNQTNIPRIGGVGKLGGVLLVADALAELADKNDPMVVNLAEGTGRAGGGLLGAVLGGGAAGSMFGPFGTLAGGLGGAFIGSGLGQNAARGLAEVLLPDGYVRDYRQGRMLDEISRQNELQAALNANQTAASVANALIESSLARR